MGQSLDAYDGIAYGVTGANTGLLPGGDGGFGWRGSWLGPGVDGLLSWWPLDASVRDAGSFRAHGVMTNGDYILQAPAGSVWSTHSFAMLSNRRSSIDFSAHAHKFDGLMRGSITFWVRSTRQGLLMAMFSASNRTSKKNLQLNFRNGLITYDVTGDLPSQNSITTGTDISDGFWHHVALTVDAAGVATIYLDGAFETTGHQGFFSHVLDVDSVWLGRLQLTNPSRFFQGDIDDLAIWGSVLTAAEVQALAALPPPLVQVAPVANGPVVASESLASPAFPSAAYGTLGFDAVGNRVSEMDGNSAARALRTQIDLSVDRDYYVSCLLRRGSAAPGAGFEVHFTDETGPHCRFGWDSSGQWIAGFDQITRGVPAMLATSYFAVFKISARASAADTAYLRVYAPSETVGATEPTTWTIVHGSETVSNKMRVLWLAQTGSGARVGVDEIRLGKTWESVTSLGYGTGCLGAVIGKSNRPAIGSSDFAVELNGASPGQSAFSSIGGSRTLWGALPLPFDLTAAGAPGCSVLASFDLTVPTVTDGAGLASITLPVPNQTALVGRAMYAQWASVDAAGTNPLPLAFSNAMEIAFEQ